MILDASIIPPVDFAILTALEIEARAVVGRLVEHQVFRDESQDIHTYHLGKIHLPEVDQSYRVVVVQLNEMGNVPAAIAITDTIARWKPKYILMVGIAGGFPQDDLDLGDVVVADQVVGYDYGKVKPAGLQFRDRVYPASQLLLDRVRSFWDEAWADAIGLQRPSNARRPRSKRFVGPIASGNKVVASETFRKKLLKRWAKLYGVEMEAEGVYAAVFARPEIRNALVIRGICDMADERKDDDWQAYAANAAAAYAISFLKSKPVEPNRADLGISDKDHIANQSITTGPITATDGATVIIAGHDANVSGISQILGVKPTLPTPHMVIEELPTLFVGREELLEKLTADLELGIVKNQMPVLALYGMGGIGKTSLAIAIAHHEKVTKTLPDGILWVSLGPEPDVMTWLVDWGKQIGRDLTSSPDLETRSRALATLLNEKKALLVVDDAWNAADARWFLVGGAGCRAVVTTRKSDVAFSLSGGNQFQVGVLSELATIQLLRDMAPEAVEEDQTATKELASILGGHPLALILAGRLLFKYRKAGFGAKEVQTNLQNYTQRIGMKDDRNKPGLPDEYSLGALLGLSYDDLAEESDRRGFRLLSVFGGEPNSFSMKAAAAVWEEAEDLTMGILSSLVSQALVQPHGRGRFTMHSLLADYASSLVDEKEEQRGKDRHSRFFYELAKNYRAKNLEKWDEWDIEWGNIRLGVNWAESFVKNEAVDQTQLSRAADYAQVLKNLILYRRPSEGGNWLEAGATAYQKMGDLDKAARLILAQGNLAIDQGNPSEATKLYQRSADLFEQAGDLKWLSYARGNLGIVEQVCDRYKSALELFRQATLVLEDVGDDEGATVGYYNIGSVCLQMGNLPEAIWYLRKCIRMCQRQDIDEYCAKASSQLAECRLAQGLLRQAEKRSEFGLEQATRTGLDDLMGYTYRVRGHARFTLSRLEEAQVDYTQSIKLLQEAHYPEELAEARLDYGTFLVKTNKLQEAKIQLEEAAKIFKQLGAQRREAICYQWMEQAKV